MKSQKMEIINLDCVILAEKPKLAPQIDRMRAALAERLDITTHQIGIKAKTGEKVDAVGRGEAISARVVVLLAAV